MPLSTNSPASRHAYYSADVATFIADDSNEVLGVIAKNCAFSIEQTQRDAWIDEIRILKTALRELCGAVFIEFDVPRIGSRIDAVFISKGTIFVIEFKTGETEFKGADINQVWDYALDLKNFHQGSHHAQIVPILVATEAPTFVHNLSAVSADGVFYPNRCGDASSLRALIVAGLARSKAPIINSVEWGNASYQPTPTIIEAAQSLYAQHSVEAISRNDAGARNLKETSVCIEALVENARRNKQKIIIFVTGVPGAGKTLVGLNIATQKRDATQPTHAVFLSGNDPLVKVLREALTRDEVARLRNQRIKTRKGDVAQKVKAFIQNVHHFRDAGIRDPAAPADHVVIFDEAQRAWNHEMTASFMHRKKKLKGFSQSEPQFLISYLDRHKDWAVVVCLVGGGQEINRGEAGISAWLDAVRDYYPSWHVYVSPDITDSEYAAGHALDTLHGRTNVTKDKRLHLATSMRSFRSENVSRFVKAVLDRDQKTAKIFFTEVSKRYPIMLTRDLHTAKNWIRQKARGSERFGLLASSGAQRLRPHAIDIRVEIDPVHWFLNHADDVRSSFYLEDAATEFQVQGLELDWVCMTWDADLRYENNAWSYHSFVGSTWQAVRKSDRQQYLLNAYRVLLTRARQGMVIFVPEGDSADKTRSSSYYDSTFSYLKEIGIPVVEN